MAAYIELCIILEADGGWAGLQEAAGQEKEPGIRVLERGKAGGQTAYPTSLHAFLMSSAQAARWDVCWECLCRIQGQWDALEEEDGSRRMRHIPLGASRHSRVLQVGQVL